jgi:hypothetical protein
MELILKLKLKLNWLHPTVCPGSSLDCHSTEFTLLRAEMRMTMMNERRAKLRQDMRAADDPEKPWPINELVEAIGLVGATKNRLLHHFVKTGRAQISLRELMDMCVSRSLEGSDVMTAPLSSVRGISRQGFWSVVNGLRNMNLGGRCHEEWRKRFVKIKPRHEVTGAPPV